MKLKNVLIAISIFTITSSAHAFYLPSVLGEIGRFFNRPSIDAENKKLEKIHKAAPEKALYFCNPTFDYKGVKFSFKTLITIEKENNIQYVFTKNSAMENVKEFIDKHNSIRKTPTIYIPISEDKDLGGLDYVRIDIKNKAYKHTYNFNDLGINSRYNMVVAGGYLKPYNEGWTGVNEFWNNSHYPHSITALKKIDLPLWGESNEVPAQNSSFKCIRK